MFERPCLCCTAVNTNKRQCIPFATRPGSSCQRIKCSIDSVWCDCDSVTVTVVVCRTGQAPPHGNVLYLNGQGSGLVNNACFPSAVAPSYAPSGQVSTPFSLFSMLLPTAAAWFLSLLVCASSAVSFLGLLVCCAGVPCSACLSVSPPCCCPSLHVTARKTVF